MQPLVLIRPAQRGHHPPSLPWIIYYCALLTGLPASAHVQPLQSSWTGQLCHFSAQNLPITPVLKTPYNKLHGPLSQPVSLRSYSFLWSHPSLSFFLELMLPWPGVSPLMSAGDAPPPPNLRQMLSCRLIRHHPPPPLPTPLSYFSFLQSTSSHLTYHIFLVLAHCLSHILSNVRSGRARTFFQFYSLLIPKH